MLGEQPTVDPNDWMEEFEGQLAIDVYHTSAEVVLKAPIAGVRQEDLEVTITDERITIKGERHDNHNESVEGYLIQECYWGSFSRTYDFPVAVDSDNATAKLVDGILTISVPKTARARSRTLSVSME
jgi:HSP20 family protein